MFAGTVISLYKNGYFNNNSEYDKLYSSCLVFRTVFSFRKDNSSFIKLAVSPTLTKIAQWMEMKVSNEVTGINYSLPRYVGYIAHRASLGLMISYFEHAFNCCAVY